VARLLSYVPVEYLAAAAMAPASLSRRGSKLETRAALIIQIRKTISLCCGASFRGSHNLTTRHDRSHLQTASPGTAAQLIDSLRPSCPQIKPLMAFAGVPLTRRRPCRHRSTAHRRPNPEKTARNHPIKYQLIRVGEQRASFCFRCGVRESTSTPSLGNSHSCGRYPQT